MSDGRVRESMPMAIAVWVRLTPTCCCGCRFGGALDMPDSLSASLGFSNPLRHPVVLPSLRYNGYSLIHHIDAINGIFQWVCAMRLLAALLLFWMSTVCAAQVQLSGGRLFELPDGSQLVFGLSAPTDYRSFLLDNPPRFVIDLKGTAAHQLEQHLVSQDVQGVRSGVRERTQLRVVVDLTRPVYSQVSVVERDGYHLVLDVFRSRQPVFADPSELSFTTPRVQAAQTVATAALPSIQLLGQAATSATDSDSAATTNAEARQMEPVALITRRRDIVIAIDPGHGGRDPGAVGPSGVREKDVVLEISKRLARLINDEPGMRAILTRDRDVYLRLFERVAIARQHNADLFISVHADAFTSPQPRGASVYMLSTGGASSSMARWLAESENESARQTGDDLNIRDRELRQVVYDMVHDAVLAESNDAGSKILSRMGQVGRLHSANVERANFAVLRAPDMPSILVEAGFISNPEEEKLLNTASYQQRLAVAIMEGIREFAQSRPGLGLEIVDTQQPSGTRSYVVKRGDTLFSIARRYDVSVNQLLSINGISSAHQLPAGITIRIPEG